MQVTQLNCYMPTVNAPPVPARPRCATRSRPQSASNVRRRSDGPASQSQARRLIDLPTAAGSRDNFVRIKGARVLAVRGPVSVRVCMHAAPDLCSNSTPRRVALTFHSSFAIAVRFTATHNRRAFVHSLSGMGVYGMYTSLPVLQVQARGTTREDRRGRCVRLRGCMHDRHECR